MRWVRIAGLALAAALVAAQFIRPVHTNPPADGGFDAPAAVAAVLHRACFDCHSNDTAWPWYGSVAPLSWLLVRDVNEGRRRLNFSDWADYASDPDTLANKFGQIAQRVGDGSMAPLYYRALHTGARLTPSEQILLTDWARAGRARAAAAAD